MYNLPNYTFGNTSFYDHKPGKSKDILDSKILLNILPSLFTFFIYLTNLNISRKTVIMMFFKLVVMDSSTNVKFYIS